MTSPRKEVKRGGGRPSPWQNSPTCTIRIPQVFEAILLEVAKNLDQCNEDMLVIDLKSLSIHPQAKKKRVNLLKVQVYKHSSGKVVNIKELVEAFQVHLNDS